LQGNYPNPTVHRVHGVDFQSGAPAVDDTWVYVSTPFGTQPFQWQHSKLKTSQVQNDSTVTGTNADDALEHLDSTKVPTTRTLTINGTTQDLSANRTFTIATGLTVGTTPITSGGVGRILFEGTGNVLQESANLFWDNTNARLGIGTATPASRFQVKSSGTNTDVISILNTSNGSLFRIFNGGGGQAIVDIGGSIFFRSDAALSYINSGNFAIGTTTDAGFKLDVNGTARFSGNITIPTNVNFLIATPGAGTNGVNIRSESLTSILFEGGTGTNTSSDVFFRIATSFSNISGTHNYQQFQGSILPTSGSGVFNVINISNTINQTGGANGITRGLYINPTLTAAADFRALETTVGNVMLNTTSGNTLIGTTTNAGFKLDVNGTARVSATGSFNTTFANTGISVYNTYAPTGYNSWLVGVETDYFAVYSGRNIFYIHRTRTNGNSYLNTDYFRFGSPNAATAQVDIESSSTTRSSLRIRSGVAPTTPNDGDIWYDGTNLKMRIAGVTKTFNLI
jgi:hypothetical protein